MQDNKNGCSVLVIVVIAIIIGVMLFFGDLMKWILIGVGVIVAAIIILLVILNIKQKQKLKEVVAEGITAGDVKDILKQSNQRLQELRKNYYKLKDTKMQEELEQISSLFKQIFKIVENDPKDIKAARRYINTTFSSLETIIGQSVTLFDSPNLTQDAEKSLKNAAEGMVMIRKATEKQINKFYENNILDLDVELTVLKKSLSARGLLDESSSAENDTEVERSNNE